MREQREDPAARLPMALAGDLERAAGAIARLDSALMAHPLRPAWAWRARLEAVRLQAMVDGQAIDPWDLAALIEGVRFRLGRSPALIDRGAVFAAAHHAFALYRWFAAPDEAQQAAIADAAAQLDAVANGHPSGGPARLRHDARPGARHGDQKRHPPPRGVRRARHRQRGDAPVEAPALWAQTPGAAARNRRPAASPSARPPPGPAERGGVPCE
jgi:hypothetical protein